MAVGKVRRCSCRTGDAAKNKEKRRIAIDEVQSKLIERLDRAMLKGPLCDIIEMVRPWLEMRGLTGIELVQAIQLALFPEAFLDSEELAGRIQGIMPQDAGGIGTYGARMFSEMMTATTLKPLGIFNAEK